MIIPIIPDNISWVVNILLLISKAYAWQISNSSVSLPLFLPLPLLIPSNMQAVLASLVDSFVDLVSQLVIFLAEYKARRHDERFPVGQARLETLGVLACAVIMGIASAQVIIESSSTLYDGLVLGELPVIDASLVMYLVLGSATVLKAVCYAICQVLASRSDSMEALAEDHLNDIMSNIAAAATAALATQIDGCWWIDASVAILLSFLIITRWISISMVQVGKIVGREAPQDFMNQLSCLINSFQVEVDSCKAYHWGSRYLVELEIVLPVDTPFQAVHDLSLALQIKIESMQEVERAFVHADYQRRELPEHRTERVLRGLPVPKPPSPALLSSPTAAAATSTQPL
jgi:cation diffusion facilitator family transporter